MTVSIEEYLLSRYSYDPETGLVKNRLTERILTYIHESGYAYITGRFQGLTFRVRVHRFAWRQQTGRWPTQVDHINRIKSDNRWCNLREATDSENRLNSKLYKNNRSGVKGVCFDRKKGKWVASYKRKVLGRFSSFEDAITVREQAEQKDNQL